MRPPVNQPPKPGMPQAGAPGQMPQTVRPPASVHPGYQPQRPPTGYPGATTPPSVYRTRPPGTPNYPSAQSPGQTSQPETKMWHRGGGGPLSYEEWSRHRDYQSA